MTEERVKRKLSAILSADAAGYSRLMGEDEVSTVRTLEAYRKVMSDLIEQFRGRVVDSPGDNLLSEFSSVVDAVQCAVEIHEVMRAKNEELPEDRRMLFRIGVNLGDVIEEGDRIYGDGVNIAARLEGLAEAGGICISGSAHEQIKNKLALGYEYIGEHTVKNIAEPLKVYRVPIGPKAAISKEGDEKETKLKKWRWTALGAAGAIIVIIGALAIWHFYLRGPSIEPALIEKMAYPLPDKPSVAVLPFKNETGDPEQDYIGDGLSRSICDALSASSQMFVIDRNATYIYRETPVKPQQVAKDLGVQYILDGSIQKSGDRLRVTVQLTDALAGHYLWSDKYDREMKEIFEIEDEITKEIMVSLQVVLSGSEDLRVYAKSTDNLEAWKHYIKGIELYDKMNKGDNLNAREHFEAALELDPEFVAALSKLAQTHAQDFIFEWGDSPLISLNRAIKLAKKAVELDGQDPSAHAILGAAFLYQKEFEKAITEGKRAIDLNPNYAYGHVMLALTMDCSGRFDEAITLCKKASRLNPNPPPLLLYTLTTSYIFLKRYEEALEGIRQMEKHVPPGSRQEALSKVHYSWVYQELGREDEARAYMAEALKIKPDFSLENFANNPYKYPAYLQRELDAHRKAGMPEHPPGAVKEKSSIAVLPFDDISPDKDQEYFVDGLSEEILNSLTQIPDLLVTGRISSFSFKGTNKKVPEIARELGVNHILEGSVRKVGNALRITAQLLRGEDGFHLWSKQYDKQFKVDEVLSIQEDIANSVADKLKLTLEAFQLLGGTEDIDAYELYLRAKGIFGSGNLERIHDILNLLDDATSRDPNFALAWSFKARNHILLHVYEPAFKSIEEANAGIKAVQKAIDLEPNLMNPYVELGAIKMLQRQWIEAELNFRKSLELTNESISGDHIMIIPFYLSVGKLKNAQELLEEMIRNDPINRAIGAWYCLTWGLLDYGQRAEDEYDLRNKKDGYTDFYNRIITGVRIGSGDKIFRDDIVSFVQISIKLKEYIDSPKKGLNELHSIYNNDRDLSTTEYGEIALWAAYFGDPEFAMASLEKGAMTSGDVMNCWFPLMKEVRQLPRFKEFVSEIGLVDYWKQYGWPDLCRPVGDDDFECD